MKLCTKCIPSIQTPVVKGKLKWGAYKQFTRLKHASGELLITGYPARSD